MKILFILFLLIFLLTVNIFSQQYFMIPAGDPVLDDIKYLSVAAGKSFLSFAPPLSPDEVKNFLDLIDEKSLSSSEREVYDRVLNKLIFAKPPISWSDKEDNFSVLFNINFELEGKIKFNSDVSWNENESGITPLFAFPLQLFFFNVFQLFIEPTIGLRPGKSGTGIFYTNIPYDPYHFSVQYWPFRAFLAAGGSWYNFQIGKDHLRWGTAHTGSMLFSNDSVFYDFVRLSLFSSHVKYSIMINQMPLNLHNNLIDDSLFDTSPEGWNEKGNNSSVNRYFYLHRIDINIMNKISVGIMEGIMTGNSPIELRFLNPLLIYHSLYAWEDYDKWEPNNGDMIGSVLSLELNINILKSFAVYGQIIMNQFALPSETDKQSNQPPNGLGYIAGIHFTHSFKNLESIFFLEFIYTDPYLNLLASPYASFIQQNVDYYLISHSRDTISLSLGGKFKYNSSLNFSGVFSWTASGEHNANGLKWDWEQTPAAFREKTPSGTAENKFLLTIQSQWKPLSWLFLKASVTGIVSHNNRHSEGELAFGGQAAFAAGIRY